MMRRGLGAALLAAGMAGTVIWTRSADRRAAMRQVPSEITPPFVEVPGRITSERISGMVAAVGDALAPKVPLPDGVSRCTVPGPAGAPPVTVYLYEPAHAVASSTHAGERADASAHPRGHEPARASARTLRPGPAPAVLYIHGGGHVVARAAFYHHACRRIADDLGAVVVSVDYRLAPKDPFPADVEDCYAALRWMHEHAAGLGIDSGRIALAGDSAGGGLTAAVCQMAHDRGEVPVAFQAMKYPMLDDRTAVRDSPPGGPRAHGRFMWTPASNAYAWTAYLGHAPSPEEPRPYAVPARRADLTGLPPAWIGVGDLDLFHDEAIAYAERLRSAGVPCELCLVPGMYHAADVLHPRAPSMVAFESSMLGALRTALC